MGAEFNYDEDQNLDYSDLSDKNRSALERARSKWGRAEVINGGYGYNPESLHNSETNQPNNKKIEENDITANENSGQWQNNVTGGGGSHKSRNSLKQGQKFFGKFKSATATMGAGIIISTALAWIFGITTGGLVAMHMEEMITQNLNSVATVLDMRFKNVLNLKLNYKVKGTKCIGGVICRMSSVSEYNIKNLEKAGFKVNTGKDTIFGNKKTIESLEFTDPATDKVTKIGNNSKEIKQFINNNVEGRKAMRKGYNGRFASFLDKHYNKLRSWAKGLFKAKPDNKGKSEDEIVDDINKQANNNIDDVIEDAQKKPDNNKKRDSLPDDDANDATNLDDSAGNKALKETLEEIGEETKSLPIKEKAAKASAKLNNFTSKVAPALGGLAAVCGLYNFGVMAYTATKDVKVQLLSQFALSFLSYTDKTRTGHSTQEEVSAVNNALMSTHKSSKNKTEESVSRLQNALDYFANIATENSRKAATDSQGYRATAYNDSIGELDESAKHYSNGASGPFEEFMKNITSGVVGWVAREGCKAVGWAGAAIGIVAFTSLALCLVSGGATCAGETVKAIGWKVVVGIAAQAIISFATAKIVDGVSVTLAGMWSKDFVNSETAGEDYGNAVVSGAGALMSKNARAGGAQVLTRNQAVAFYHKNQELIAQYAEEVRSSTSPFDPTTRHTFLGSIVSSIIPHAKSIRSFANFIPSMVAISARSIANILPGASASNAAGFEANMNVCQDTTITETGAATDIFCNVYTGIDTNYADKESDEIIQELINTNQLKDDDSKDSIVDNVISGSDLEKYINHCYNRKAPIGLPDEDGNMGDTCNSAKNPKASLFAVFLTDVRINEGLEEGLNPKSRNGSGGENNNTTSGDAKNDDCKEGDLCWPIKGANAGMVWPDRWFHGGHNGIDFGRGGVVEGTPVYNIADGEVMAVGKKTASGLDYKSTYYSPNIYNGLNKGGCGNTPGDYGGGEQNVLIKHNIKGQTYYSVYSHLKSNTQEVISLVGKKIKAGVKVGEVGSYGCSSGPHLHFMIQTTPHTSGWIDPKTVLGELK